MTDPVLGDKSMGREAEQGMPTQNPLASQFSVLRSRANQENKQQQQILWETKNTRLCSAKK